jgi:hypothetical protein
VSDLLTINQNELTRLEEIKRIEKKTLKQKEAAIMAGISESMSRGSSESGNHDRS